MNQQNGRNRDGHTNTDGQGDLFVRSSGRVSRRLLNRTGEEGVQVQGVSAAGPGEQDRGEDEPGKKAADRRVRSHTFKCDTCRQHYPISERDSRWRRRCVMCADRMRDAQITCPTCKNLVQFKRSDLVKLQFNPGRAEGKTFSVRYCDHCSSFMRSRARTMAVSQAKELEEVARDQRKFIRGG